jgi:hypothetical protein
MVYQSSLLHLVGKFERLKMKWSSSLRLVGLINTIFYMCSQFENFHLIRKMQGKQNDHLDLIVISILPSKYHTKSKSPHVWQKNHKKIPLQLAIVYKYFLPFITTTC